MRVTTASCSAVLGLVLPLSAWATPPRPLHDAAPPAAVSSEGGSAMSAGPLAWLERDRLSGDWGGRRTALEERGVAIEATYVLDGSKPLSGGSRKRETARSLFDLNVAFDLHRMLGLSGGTFFLDAYARWGRNGSGDTGDFQGYSDIDADDDRVQLAEVWYQQYLFGERLRIKVGKVDANSEFAFVDAAGDFINVSALASPTILALPTYPDPAMSVNVFAYPTDSFYLGAAVYDGAGNDGVPTGRRGPETFFSDSRSDDYFAIGEVGLLWDGGRAAAGPWFHTADFERWDGGIDHGTVGMFALVEHQVWRENPQGDEDEQGVAVFGQYGYADEDLTDVQAVHHVGVGALWNGAIPGQDDDALGLMVSWVDLSDAPGAGFSRNDTVLELFYLRRVTRFLGLQGDIQYVVNPSGDGGATDVVVATLRVEVSF